MAFNLMRWIEALAWGRAAGGRKVGHFGVPSSPVAAIEKALREQRENWEALEEERRSLIERLDRVTARQGEAAMAITDLEDGLERHRHGH